MTICLLFQAGFAALLVASAAACGLNAETAAEGMFDRTIGVGGPVTLDIRTGSGSIAVRRGASDSVRVVARIRGHSWRGGNVEDRVRRIEAAPPIEQNGTTIRIGHFHDAELARDINISYEVTAPPDTQLQSRTGSGDQTIDDLRGPIDVNTGSGSILTSHVGTDVRASTGSGDIQGTDLGGSFTGRTGSGSIRINGVGGAVTARTGSGDVELAQTAEGDVDIATGSGSIEVTGARRALRVRAASGDIELEGRPGLNWDVASRSGSIRIRFAADSAFELNARTGSGPITTSHPLALLETGSRTRVRGTVRGGGPRVDVSAASGSIQVQ